MISLKGLCGCLVGVGERVVPRRWYQIVVACLPVVWVLLGAGQAWGAGSASGFTELTGSGQSLIEEREGAVAATLPSGQVLIAGGVSGTSRVLSAELFDPATNTFAKLTGPGQSLVARRQLAIAATLPSGQVLIAGGTREGGGALSGAELFSPVTDTFTKLTGPGQSLIEGRFGAVAAMLPSGEVLIAGGVGASGFLSSAELFNPATDTFSKLAGSGQSMLEARDIASAAELPNGDVLIVGGYTGSVVLASAELFNPAADTFTKLTGAGQSLTEARYGAVAARLPSGQVLVAGGSNPAGCTSHCVETGVTRAELFNPATDTFEPTSPPVVSRHGAVAATLPSGEVLIAGGDTTRQLADHSAELFGPVAQAEIAGASFGEQALGKHSAVGMVTVTSIGAAGALDQRRHARREQTPRTSRSPLIPAKAQRSRSLSSARSALSSRPQAKAQPTRRSRSRTTRPNRLLRRSQAQASSHTSARNPQVPQSKNRTTLPNNPSLRRPTNQTPESNNTGLHPQLTREGTIRQRSS